MHEYVKAGTSLLGERSSEASSYLIICKDVGFQADAAFRALDCRNRLVVELVALDERAVSGPEAEVRFDGRGTRVRVRLSCATGAPQLVEQRSDPDGGGSDDDAEDDD